MTRIERVILVIFGVTVLSLTVQSHRVCYTSVASNSQAPQVHYRTVYAVGYSTYLCGFLWLGRCRRSHVTNSIRSYTGYYSRISYAAVLQCCTGYTGTYPNCQAYCVGGCHNGGVCTLPGVCTCDPGWTGANCEQDVNECNGDHQCDHNCTNVDGSHVCSCDGGYVLLSAASGFASAVGIVLVILIFIIVIVIVRRRWKKQQNLSMFEPTSMSMDHSVEQKNETTVNAHYARSTDVVTMTAPENIYDTPRASEHIYEEPPSSTKKTSIQLLAQRKESNSHYEKLASVEEPGNDP